MRRVHDLRCLACDRIEQNVVVEGEAFPECGWCGGERDWVPTRVNTDIWGQPTYVRSLDREFSGRSELRQFLKANGLQEAGDKVNGARTFRMPDHQVPRGTGKARRGVTKTPNG